jgi:pimeloyl-ACP methyl ester carboxylesterase
MKLSVNGSNAYVYTGSKPLDSAHKTVVFIHGAANDHSVWALQSRWFAHHGYNALAVDLPGHGRSDGAALASVEALSEWLLNLLDAAEIEQAILAGHSMGSLVALETAGRAPQRILKLALLGCAVPMAVSDQLLEAAAYTPEKAMRMIVQWSHAPANLLGGGAIPGFWLGGMNLALMRRAAPGILHCDLLNCREYTHGVEAAKAVGCPTLLLAAERDLMTPAKAAQSLRESLADWRVAPIAGAGHAMMSERADAVLKALAAFF